MRTWMIYIQDKGDLGYRKVSKSHASEQRRTKHGPRMTSLQPTCQSVYSWRIRMDLVHIENGSQATSPWKSLHHNLVHDLRNPQN